MSNHNKKQFKSMVSQARDAQNAAKTPDLIGNLDERKRQQDLDHDHDIHKLRKEYLPKTYWLIITYLTILGGIIIFSQLNFGLSNSVLVALLTTTSANVLGIFYIVTKWLFPNKAKHA